MNTLRNDETSVTGEAITRAMVFPKPMDEGAKYLRLAVFRDTLIVLGLQLVFRAMMLLRRWNY
jgi:hypothetical protein